MNAALAPDAAILYLLDHTAAMLSRQNDQILQEQLGIGLSQFKILQLLLQHPELQQRQLASHLGQTEASVSRQVKLMREKGLLAQRIDPHNRRAHLTEPTAKGAKLADAAQTALTHAVQPLLAKLPDKQQKQLLDSLQLFHHSLCHASSPTACDRPFDI